MSEEETKIEAAAEETTEVVADPNPEVGAAPKKKMKKWPIITGVIVVVLIAAGAGFWVWHEQPSFCSAICHTPMDSYVETYDQEAGTAGTDKWGNEVADTNSMLVVSHKKDDVDCLGCHVPTIQEQVTEGINWVTGNYEYPLYERDLKQLTAARGADADEFCLNESCHNITRDDLIKATSGMERNPHVAQHGKQECSSCHKAHRASVMACTQCHSDAEVPDGWLTAAEATKLTAA